ncbi:TraM recognition domain-containing protein [Conexibacter stalactiti]|uniref:TraM recognition domain-containing protein n=1 Tax=Conexibacter stalactiti TaxID=1940611 RepID=A0ABU4HPC1_9ACTN|nr:TraM recognition domain-containing protein [Conexibacter stalactiti]MDW5595104.1 TraM recognition domain-containing protein [Conexibacter stalactiti]MEC5035746.1 TraM recognition domain-containing protein [Conexibacter stalactiti]
MGGLAVMAAVGLVLVEIPLGVWALLRGELFLANPLTVIAGLIQLLVAVATRRPFDPPAAFGVSPDELPPLWVAIVINAMVLSGVVLLVVGGWFRVDRWRSRSQLGTISGSPKRKVEKRVWAKPRDLLHLQPLVGSRSGAVRRASNALMRVLLWVRSAPAPIGGDSWNLGRLHGAELRSGREVNVIGLAPTGAGKTMRLVATAIREHLGPMIVLLNKTDVMLHTLAACARRGPVWIFAPMTDLTRLGLNGCCWTPLFGCEDWGTALRTSRALFDADPNAAKSSAGSDGAHFYASEAKNKVLPPLLHAAALAGRSMSDVLGWLQGGLAALDEPRELLEEHGAEHAALIVAGIQQQDERARSYSLATAAQLVAVYRFPEVQAIDRDGFDVEQLLAKGGTLFLIAPESMQDELAPLLGGILGEVVRFCEDRASRSHDMRRLPLVKIVADEAAHLAPLAELPTYLAVSRGWGVRWMLIYQSLAQLRARYGVQADTILANTGAKLLLGPIHDRATREELMALLGDEPITRTSHTTRAWGGDRSITQAQEQRPKLSADDLARLGEGEAVLIHGRDVPAIVRLPFWWEWTGARSPEDALDWEEGEQR